FVSGEPELESPQHLKEADHEQKSSVDSRRHVFGRCARGPWFCPKPERRGAREADSDEPGAQAAREAAKKALGSEPTEAKIVTGTKPQQYELAAQNSSRKEFAV